MCICFVVNAYYTLKADTQLKDAYWYLVQCLSKKNNCQCHSLFISFKIKSKQTQNFSYFDKTKTKYQTASFMSSLDILITDDQIYKTKN